MAQLQHKCEYTQTITKVPILGLITHWRTAPAHRRNDGVKLIGCDICDAFNIVNGFRDEEAVEVHTKHVHGEVRNKNYVILDCLNGLKETFWLLKCSIPPSESPTQWTELLKADVDFLKIKKLKYVCYGAWSCTKIQNNAKK